MKFRSWDYQGNAESVQTQVIQAPTDGVAPSTTISCNDAACGSSAYVATVTVKLAATDTGGSGVAATYYTTDGSTPTTTSPTYTAPFTLSSPGTYPIRYFSTDRAGNAEQVQSQSVTVDPVKTKVSLTFDNGSVGQYTLGYLKALKPHGDTATFYVNSGTVSVSGNTMTWSQLGDLAAAGNDIGGKTVNATNLTTDPNPTSQVCDDRTALRQHGLDPVGFAYPGGAGANDQTIRDIVKNCGYGVARSAGSLSPTGPTYAEKLPPNAWYSTRAYAPSGQVTLANLKALVNGAASSGGGWTQAVITRVCSQTEDPNGYTACTGASGWIELSDLELLPRLDGPGGPERRRPGRRRPEHRPRRGDRRRHQRPGDHGDLQRFGLRQRDLHLDGVRRPVGHRRRVGRRQHPLHHRRLDADPVQPDVHRPDPDHEHDHPDVPLLGPRRQCREPEHSRRHDLSRRTPRRRATTIACDGQPCTANGYNGSTKVSLTADDGTGWGVDSTYYTTDGSTPTASSAAYNGPFTLGTAGTYTVKWFSTDLAGNAEQVQSQQIVVDPPKVVVSLTFDDGC